MMSQIPSNSETLIRKSLYIPVVASQHIYQKQNGCLYRQIYYFPKTSSFFLCTPPCAWLTLAMDIFFKFFMPSFFVCALKVHA